MRDLTGVARVVVKVGTSTLTGGGPALRADRLEALVAQVAEVKKRGLQAVVVSSGAIAAGLGPLGMKARPRDMPSLQAAAAVGQGLLIRYYQEAFSRHGLVCGQVLLTREDFSSRRQYLNARNTMERLLALGVVPVVNENDTVAVEEIRFGDNDILGALVTHLVGADLFVILSDVDGVYTGDPRCLKRARLVREVSHPEELSVEGGGPSMLGSGGMASKVQAAWVATFSGAGVVVANGARPGVILEILDGAEVGTYFRPARRRLDARRLWIAFASPVRGRVAVDEGAARALLERGKSLLVQGVRGVEGRFQAGETVEVTGPSGSVLARGKARFSREELELALGEGWEKARAMLGKGPEVVHRDDMVVLARGGADGWRA